MTNKQAWATAKEAHERTIRAANAVLVQLRREGISGYCQHSEAFTALIEQSQATKKLASDFPADYWAFYRKEPSEFDGTAWVKAKEAECRRIAAEPLGV